MLKALLFFISGVVLLFLVATGRARRDAERWRGWHVRQGRMWKSRLGWPSLGVDVKEEVEGYASLDMAMVLILAIVLIGLAIVELFVDL